MNFKSTLCLALLVPSLASADFDDLSPGDQLGQVADWLAKDADNIGTSTAPTADQCPPALANMKAKKLDTVSSFEPALGKFGGVKNETTLEYDITLGNAQRMCKRAEVTAIARKDVALFLRIGQDMVELEDISLGEGIADAAIENANKCVAAVHAMVAAGVPASFPYKIVTRTNEVLASTVGELEQNVCEANRKLALRYTKQLGDQTKADDARLAKAGLSGDKLSWFKHYDGQVFLAGGSAPGDLTRYAAASVWFAYTYSSDPDAYGRHLFTVRRYQFNGASLAKKSEKIYMKPLGFKASIGSVMK